MQPLFYLFKGSINLLTGADSIYRIHSMKYLELYLLFLHLDIAFATWILTLLTLSVAMISIKVIKDQTQIQLFLSLVVHRSLNIFYLD